MSTEPICTILVVDDEADNIETLQAILRPHYRVKAALTGGRALQICQAEQPDLILLDVMMPGIDGFRVCEFLKSDPITAQIPVIFVTARNATDDEAEGLALGAVDYITKPLRPAIVKARVRTHLRLRDQRLLLEDQVRERTRELARSRQDIIMRLGHAAEYKDNETGAHITRMAHYSRLLAAEVSDDENWVDVIFQSAPMHDIGKIGIPDAILQKPMRLDESERALMEQHPAIGADIIGTHGHPLLKTAREIALGHHEKWDGSGYPKGLAGVQIPLPARIVAIADVFDALTSVRPYKKAWSEKEALDYICSQSGKHFDPSLVEAFMTLIPEIRQVGDKYGDDT